MHPDAVPDPLLPTVRSIARHLHEPIIVAFGVGWVDG